jgi:hypothetical protein
MTTMDDIRHRQDERASAVHVPRADPEDSKTKHVNNLGSIQLRHPVTNDIILIPTPSNDLNDPLNWYELLDI